MSIFRVVVDALQKYSSGAAHTVEQGIMAGERNPGSKTASWNLAMPAGNPTRCDSDTTETLVVPVPCAVLFITGNDGNTGYSDLIDANAIGGGGAPKFRVNCGDGVNPQPVFSRFENGLCVKGESVGHDITVVWWPL